MNKENKWGFLRETSESAKKAGIDRYTGLHRTGLEVYLKHIFPDVNDWEHDKTIPNITRKIRPDYRSETLKLIVEFDGLPHYQKPDVILGDIDKTKFYEGLGYKVIRIPYFIQLTNKTIKRMFNVDIKDEMFPEDIPSLNTCNSNTPAYLCFLGVERMKKDFELYPEQYKVNINSLKSEENEQLTGINLLIIDNKNS